MRFLMAVVAVGTLAGCPADDVPSDVLDGEWSLSWTCTAGCPGPAVELATSTTMTASGGDLTWDTSPPSTLSGTRADGCVIFDDGTPLPHPVDLGWNAYDLEVCGDGVSLAAELYVIRSAGAVQERWSMSGERP